MWSNVAAMAKEDKDSLRLSHKRGRAVVDGGVTAVTGHAVYHSASADMNLSPADFSALAKAPWRLQKLELFHLGIGSSEAAWLMPTGLP